MGTVKPQRLGVMHRTYEHADKCWFVPSVMVAFDVDRPDIPLHEALLWRSVAETLPLDEIFDEGMWKLRGEVLVSGAAFPPKRPATACPVRLVLGPEHAPLVDKRLYVVGHRRWESFGSTEPEAFDHMPLSWARAFGGEGLDNARGCGARPGEALPNVEDPRRLLQSPDDRPGAVGLSGVELTRSFRRKLAGTYDQAWLERDYPGFPRDIDWRFFNVAPLDQRLPKKLAGGEPFLVENMHPERPRLEGRVPELVARAFITRRDEPQLHEIALEPDTLHLLPGVARGVLIFRGVVEVQEDDASDVTSLLVALEAPGQARSHEHYADVRLRRTEGEDRGIHALMDDELLPPLPEGVDPLGHDDLRGGEAAELPPLAKNVLAGAKEKLAALEARKPATPEGMDPIPMPPLIDVDPSPALEPRKLLEQMKEARRKAEEQKQEAERRQTELEAKARERAAAMGFDLDAQMEEARRDLGGPPKFSAEAHLTRLRGLMELSKNAGIAIPGVAEQLDDPRLAERLEEAERAQREAYRKNAHFYPAGRRLEGDEAAALRRVVEEARATGAGLGGRDPTGADLRGLDLGGMSLRGAFLDNADLTGARLVGTDLREAVLSRVEAREADWSEADLSDANLGAATLAGARLAGARLAGANLYGTDLTGADLSGAVLDRVVLLTTKLAGARLAGARGARLVANQIDMRGCDFRGAELVDGALVKVTLDGARFDGARLDRTCLLDTSAVEAGFDDVQADSLRVVGDSDLSRSSFRRARLTRANLRGVALAKAIFDEAELTAADLSEADLSDASLQCIRGRELSAVRTRLDRADLYGADLMFAILQKAEVAGACFEGSNLFGADLAKVRGDDATSLSGANVARTRFVKRGAE